MLVKIVLKAPKKKTEKTKLIWQKLRKKGKSLILNILEKINTFVSYGFFSIKEKENFYFASKKLNNKNVKEN